MDQKKTNFPAPLPGVLLADNRTLIQTQPAYRCEPGGPLFSQYHNGGAQPLVDSAVLPTCNRDLHSSANQAARSPSLG